MFGEPCWLATLVIGLMAEDLSVSLDQAGISLQEVRDRERLSHEESPAYHAILDHAARLSVDDLRHAGRAFLERRWKQSAEYRSRPESDFPIFVDMIEHPDAYRGQPVLLRGHLIRHVTYDAGPNDDGIETLFEGWLVTEHAQTHPVTVVCTANPDGIPIGEELIDGITVAGYFFKLHNYSSRDNKVRFAPMILAHSMSWNPPPVPGGLAVPALVRYGGLALLAAALIVLVWRLRRRPAALESVRQSEPLPESAPAFLKTLATDDAS